MLLLGKWINWFMYIFVLSSLLIPVAPINKIIFILIFVFYGIQFLNTRKIKFITASPIIILIIFIYGYFKSLFEDSSSDLALQFMLFTSILLLIYPIIKNKINFEKIIKVSGIVFTLATIYIYIFILKDIKLPVVDSLENILYTYGSVAMGYRGFFGKDNLFIHLGSVPFLYLPICIFFKEFIERKEIKKLLLLSLMLLAVHLSSSRALMLGTILTMVLLFIYKSNNRTKIMKMLILGSLLYISFIYILLHSNIFDLNEQSNKVKIGDAISFFETLTLSTLFWGKGLATYFFASGRDSMAAHTENSLFDTVRYLGLILTFVTYSNILFPKINFKFPRKNIEDLIIIFIYLIMSMTNPILFNSLGGILILWYWSKILCRDEYGKASQ